MPRFLIASAVILGGLATCSCSSPPPHAVREFHGAIADPYHDSRAKVKTRSIPVVESGLLPGGRRYIGFVLSRPTEKPWSVQHAWGATTLLLTGDLSTGAPIRIMPGDRRVRAWFVSNVRIKSKLLTTERLDAQWNKQLKAAWAAADQGKLPAVHPEATAVPLYGTVRIDRFALPEFSTVAHLSSDRSPRPNSKALLTGTLCSRDLTSREKALLRAAGVLGVISAIAGVLSSGSLDITTPSSN